MFSMAWFLYLYNDFLKSYILTANRSYEDRDLISDLHIIASQNLAEVLNGEMTRGTKVVAEDGSLVHWML